MREAVGPRPATFGSAASDAAPSLNGHRRPPADDVIARMVRRLAAVTVAGIDDPLPAAGLTTLASGIVREPEPGDEAVDRLTRGFGLSPFERDLLVLIGLPEEHDSVTMAVRRLNLLGEPWMAPATLSTVLGLDHRGQRHLRNALDSGPLRRHGLVVVNEAQPFPEASVRLLDGLWSAIRGGGRWPGGLRPQTPVSWAIDRPQPDRVESLFEIVGRVADAAVGSATDTVDTFDRGAWIVVVTGGGRSNADLVAALSAGLQTASSTPRFFDPEQLGPDRDPAVSAHCVVRNAIPVITGRPAHNPLPGHPGPIVICVDDLHGLDLDDRPVIAVDLGPRTMAEDIEMWRRLVPELADVGAPAALAGLLRVDATRAGRAVGDARATAQLDNTDVTTTMVIDQVRRRSTTTLPPSVQLVRPTAGWEGLVTTDRNLDLLASIVGRVAHQTRVLHDWRFGDLPGRRHARGARALFVGPPGTGKTLSAEVVAGVLGLDLLVVDLSALVSKWLGETEKNISEVFDAADRCQSVLFFDEADAVFARRTDGSDAQGRWANLETAHLLARMESYDGLVVLASNLRGNIDEAFIRRLDVIVEFDEPNLDERRRLWRQHLPATAPTTSDVDLSQLAELYGITGGLIRNAALDAAFRAAAADHPISQLALVTAVEREYDKAGKTFPGIPRNLRMQNRRPGHEPGTEGA
ncbi:MAG: ATP-binding protein [Acidimicrobiia bacterium]|nr:ATP-binding protein [Acidimicrobiia bacterium]